MTVALGTEAAHLRYGSMSLAGGPFAGHPRSIDGVAAVWGHVTQVADGRVVRYESPDVLRFDGRVPLVLGHDLEREVGRVVAFGDTPAGRLARVLVDDGPEGDRILEQARRGGGFSASSDPSQWRYEAIAGERLLVVEAGTWVELTVCFPRAAYQDCRITAVGGVPLPLERR